MAARIAAGLAHDGLHAGDLIRDRTAPPLPPEPVVVPVVVPLEPPEPAVVMSPLDVVPPESSPPEQPAIMVDATNNERPTNLKRLRFIMCSKTPLRSNR